MPLVQQESVVADDALLSVAVEAAHAAGAQLMARFGTLVSVQTKSSDTDPVSEADVAAERAIRALLAERRPGDMIQGEEGGLAPAAEGVDPTGLRWVVDPLDGTVNFLYGIAQFAVSVAVQDASGRGLAGVVLNPVSGEMFCGTASGPASLRRGGKVSALRMGDETRLSHALVGTGFGYDAAVRAAQGEVVAALLPRVRDVRRAGAAALDLCSVAAGRLDAYYERGVKPWDVAAGLVLCESVGLAVRRLEPASVLPAGVVVAPPEFVDELTALVS